MTAIQPDPTARIRQLNDALRTTGRGGAVMLTSGVHALSVAERQAVLAAVRRFADFNADNDPHGEHDCATVQVGGQAIIWKIDYYDLDMAGHSPAPADAALTRRVMTIMLSAEF